MTEQPGAPSAPANTGEAAVAAQVLNINQLNRDVGTLGTTFSGFVSTIRGIVRDAVTSVAQVRATASSGSQGTAPSSGATGGGYAQRAPSGQPIRTMAQAVNAVGNRVGNTLASVGGQGGGSGGGPSGGGLSLGPALAGLAVTGAFKGLSSYAKNQTPNILTMDKAAFYGVTNSGVGPGGYAASAQRVVSAIYGTSNRNLNVTAASPGDAQSAAQILNFYSGQSTYNTDGSANQRWFTAQSGLYALGYANPYASQTQVAQSLASIYSPRSNMAMRSLGYQTSLGVGGAQADPRSVAQNVFARTFQGRASVSAATLAAATGQGGSIYANLQTLAGQAGWAPGTTDLLTNYIKQVNGAVNSGSNISQINSLMDKADRGDRTAQSQLAKLGINNTTVQGIKDLQATQTGRTADQYGDFNGALQDSVGLLTDFNAALTNFLNDTGLGSAGATLGGFSSAFPGVTGGIGGFLGSATTGFLGGAGGGGGAAGGGGGGGGGGLGGVGGLASGVAGTAAAGAVWRNGAGWARAGLGRLGQTGVGGAVSSGFGRIGGLGTLARVGGGFGLGYLGTALSQNLSGAGPGSGTGSELLRTGGTTASDAAGGALIGSVFGPEGTVIGGAVGGAVGLGWSIGDWFKDNQGANFTHPYTGPSDFHNRFSNPLNTYGLGSGSSTATTGVGGSPSGVTPALGASTAGKGSGAAAVAFALAQVGKDYRWGATGPDQYDCSGLTQAAWRAGGVSIPRTSQQQMTIGSPVKPGSELPGDLMLPEPGHVTMCIGGGKLVEAPHSGAKVRVRSYSSKEFPTIRRVVGGAADATGQNTAATGGNGATGASAALSTPSLVGPNGSISEIDALSAALAGKVASPVPAQSASASTVNNTASAGSTNLAGKVTDRYGHAYAVPSGAKPSGSVASWIATALSILGQPASNAGYLKTIIQGESGGDPWSINLGDSNAAAGHPSEGLMQTIPSVFKKYALGGHGDIWNPVDSIIAGDRYAMDRYKSLSKTPGVLSTAAGRPYVGYKAGAWSVPQDGPAYLHKGEMVTPSQPADTIRNALLKDSLYSPAASAAPAGGASVTIAFAAGSIAVSIPDASPASATAAARAIVTGVTSDPRLAAMAVGL